MNVKTLIMCLQEFDGDEDVWLEGEEENSDHQLLHIVMPFDPLKDKMVVLLQGTAIPEWTD